MSCTSSRSGKETVRTLDGEMFVTQVFDGLPEDWGLPWQDIVERIRQIDDLKPSGACKRLASLVSIGFVRLFRSKYYKAH
jgi:hypothetical protein